MKEQKKLHEILDHLEPAKALSLLTPALKKILAHLDEKARVKFVTDMIEEQGVDKLSSMVNL
ncbi:MAG: hypothetical protein HY885_15525 [Deltaproteobacteria bacterium]|nr:hypothetical protein [Deltaproteobacteria bacterium]